MEGDNSTWVQAEKVRVEHKNGMGHGKADLQRQYMPRISCLMGTAKRSAVTGEIGLQNLYDIPDFFLVDLMERDRLPTTIQELSEDPYLFRPFPLAYRTWFYHSFWAERQVAGQSVKKSFSKGSANREHDMVIRSFSMRTVDAATSAGRQSPMVPYAAAALMTGFSGYGYLSMVTLGLMFCLYAISAATNKPGSYDMTRLITFPVRMAFLVWVIITFKSDTPQLILGYAAALLIPIIDVVFGDLEILRTYKYQCIHDIMRILPNRLYVCQRVGGEFQDAVFGSRGEVQECVCGFRNWSSRHTLIADIAGMLCELRPMSPEDWHQVAQEWSAGGGQPMPYIGIDSFMEDEDGLIIPNGEVLDLVKDMGFDAWASPRKGKHGSDLSVEEVSDRE